MSAPYVPLWLDPPAKKYVAGLPGVGQGLLDTLEALVGPVVVDTVRASNKKLGGEYTPGRAVLNPTALEHAQSLEERTPGARMLTSGYVEGPLQAKNYSALVLLHEWLGHGQGIYSEKLADYWARSFIRLSGRQPDLPYANETERDIEKKLKGMLDVLAGTQ